MAAPAVVQRDQWADVELDIASGFHFAPLPALARGDLDLVITADPVDEPGVRTSRCSVTKPSWLLRIMSW